MDRALKNVISTEEKWLTLLLDYSQEKFTRTRLPSHDHFHHLRVWNYAKSIISALAEVEIFYNAEEIEALIIAVFFHDLGMTVTLKKEHGIESRRMCREFFSLRPSLVPVNFDVILDMIEGHDDKDYLKLEQRSDKPPLNVLLNISDDLDAYGNIGVYRYIEIYHFRGIPVSQLTNPVLANLENRFQHFTQAVGHLVRIIDLHRKRYEKTRNFFLELENEIKFPGREERSSIKIVQVLLDFSDGKEMDIHALLKFAKDRQENDSFVNFFSEFFKEWEDK
jgi:hypothetical protein